MTGETLFLAVVAILLGLIVGSFLNVVAHRLPEGGSLVHPPSACPSCGRPIRPLENIPVLSYLALKGRCRGCGAAIGLRYPLTEAVTALATLAAALAVGPSPVLVPALLLTWLLVALARIDLDLQILPNELNGLLALLGLGLSLAGLWLPGIALAPDRPVGLPAPLDSLLGAALGYGLLFLAAWGYALIAGREGMGGGDLKLLGALGFWIGPVGVPLALFVGALGGSVIGAAVLAAHGRSRHVPIPFGPFLAFGGWALFLWREPIIRWYLHLSGVTS